MMRRMRIASLEPFITALVVSFGRGEDLVGVSRGCGLPAEMGAVLRLTRARPPAPGPVVSAKVYRLESAACSELLDPKALRVANPDIILTRVPAEKEIVPLALANIREDVNALLEREAAVISFNPYTLEEVFAAYEELGRSIETADKGIDLARRQKAQFMDWGDNFYDRMKNKRVTVISSLNPLMLAGFWVPDMIKICSAVSQAAVGKEDQPVSWREVVQFRPDVIICAPRGASLTDAARSFTWFEKQPDWDTVPAAKRGEVFFAAGGRYFYQPGHGLIESMGILVSAIAGLDSGYITPRDSFYRLRWLELQRHRFGP